MPPLLADFSHARACKPFCEKYLTLPGTVRPFYIGKSRIFAFWQISEERRHRILVRWRRSFLYLYMIGEIHFKFLDGRINF